MDTHAQIQWVQQEIMDQIDAHMQHGDIAESGPHAVLAFAHETVHHCIGKIDVQHAMCMHAHLQDTGALHHITDHDRMLALFTYFNDWVSLALAKRYA
jgi:hypothetical protein